MDRYNPRVGVVARVSAIKGSDWFLRARQAPLSYEAAGPDVQSTLSFRGIETAADEHGLLPLSSSFPSYSSTTLSTRIRSITAIAVAVGRTTRHRDPLKETAGKYRGREFNDIV